MFCTWSNCDSFGGCLISAGPLLRVGMTEVRRQEVRFDALVGGQVSRGLVVVGGEEEQEMLSHSCAID